MIVGQEHMSLFKIFSRIQYSPGVRYIPPDSPCIIYQICKQRRKLQICKILKHFELELSFVNVGNSIYRLTIVS